MTTIEPPTAESIAAYMRISVADAAHYLAVIDEATAANNLALAKGDETAHVSRRSLHVMTIVFGLVLGLRNRAATEPMLGPIGTGVIE